MNLIRFKCLLLSVTCCNALLRHKASAVLQNHDSLLLAQQHFHPIALLLLLHRCGAPNTNRSTRLAGERLTAARLRTRKAAGVANTAVPQVNVWFHVVRSGLDITQGNIPDSWITAQLDVLNGAFVGRFRFNFMGTTRTTNAAWHPLPDAAEFQMKQSLRRGTAATLNFFITRLDGGLLGVSTQTRCGRRNQPPA